MRRQLDTPMPFGKFKGKLVADLPDYYLNWLLDQEEIALGKPMLYEQFQIESQYRERFGVSVK